MAFGDSQGLPQNLGRTHFFASVNEVTSNAPADTFVDMLMTITPRTPYVRIQAVATYTGADALGEIRGLKDGNDIQPDGTTLLHRVLGTEGTLTYDYTVQVTPNVAVELGVTMRALNSGDITVNRRTLTLTEIGAVGTYDEEEDVGGG